LLPGRLWQKEVLESFKHRRSLIAKFALPLVLLSPLYLGWLPAQAKAGGLAAAVLFTGTFGSSVRLVRLRESKMLERMAILPRSPASTIADFVIANAFLDGLQLLMPTTLVIYLGQAKGFSTYLVMASFIIALISANALGVLVALAASSSGEVHLYSALAVIAVAAASGPFSGSLPQQIELISPFRLLSESLLSAWGLGEMRSPEAALISAGLLFAIALMLSPRLFRSA
jgi:hypothetical protein